MQPDDVSDTMTSNRRVVGRMVHPRVVVQVHHNEGSVRVRVVVGCCVVGLCAEK